MTIERPWQDRPRGPDVARFTDHLLGRDKLEMDLREKIARTAFEIEVGYAPDERAWARAGDYWLGFADRILAIPEIAEAIMASQDGGELDVYRANCRCDLD